jgi:hypothetical protein
LGKNYRETQRHQEGKTDWLTVKPAQTKMAGVQHVLAVELSSQHSVSWSKDDRIAVCAGKDAYIMVNIYECKDFTSLVFKHLISAYIMYMSAHGLCKYFLFYFHVVFLLFSS